MTDPQVVVASAVELPQDFVAWQLDTRRAMFERIAQEDFIPSFGAHLPVLVTFNAQGDFPIHTANKGAGFTPKDEFLEYYVRLFQDALAHCAGKPQDETRAARLAAIRLFYDHPERMDLRRLGLLEIFQGQTYRNIQAEARVALHYTDIGPRYRSYQVNGWAEIIAPGDPRYDFIYAARQLFEYERFHIHQPGYPFGYVLWIAQVYDKSPHHGRAGSAVTRADQRSPMADGRKAAVDPGAGGYPCAVTPPVLPAVAFREVLVALDNSKHSTNAMNLALQIAGALNSTVVGSHVYAARLHDQRFHDMEPGLPAKYQEPIILDHQRQLHDTLIGKGLKAISDSYLETLKQRCRQADLSFVGRTPEGKNYAELVKDIQANAYDLVVMGARGLGEVWRQGDKRDQVLGSVCERVVRRTTRDVLVVKNDLPLGGAFVVGIDGSAHGFGALGVALALAQAVGARVHAIAAYDPFLHKSVFHELKDALTAEAKQIFNTEQQEKLHDTLIDSGIAKIYRDHLETARQMAAELGAEIETYLLEGKAYPAMLRHIERVQPTLLAIGRTGIHADDGLDIGSNAENLLRLAPCHVLLVGRTTSPRRAETWQTATGAEHLAWTPEATARLERLPDFARGMAREAIEDYARQCGRSVVDEEVMGQARDKWGMG